MSRNTTPKTSDDLVTNKEPYDPNDPDAIAEYWEEAKITLKGKVIGRAQQPGQRGQQKTPTKEAVSIRLSPEVLEYFRSTGKGWQTRLDDILREYVKSH